MTVHGHSHEALGGNAGGFVRLAGDSVKPTPEALPGLLWRGRRRFRFGLRTLVGQEGRQLPVFVPAFLLGLVQPLP